MHYYLHPFEVFLERNIPSKNCSKESLIKSEIEGLLKDHRRAVKAYLTLQRSFEANGKKLVFEQNEQACSPAIGEKIAS
ncbi:hypothetical protein [Luteibaculum oceani]|uniref:Uncharacterized protein n=1 Tax=Luteibaculum oceani TaxID=1294296 RepID=A0A5C6VA36_9FLAO|nr:hypothetical protein [Luteibaculum oceani]TXC81604.1 hypothetical protein FRX97_03530 [Luteibaculum oceani]